MPKKKSRSKPKLGPPVNEYSLISATSGPDLVSQVNSALLDGWSPLGGPLGYAYAPGHPEIPQPSQFFSQAMIR